MATSHSGIPSCATGASPGCWTSSTPAATRAKAVEVERRVIDLEIVTAAHRPKERGDDVLGDVLDTLAIRAHEMMVMLRIAGDVRRDVALPLEAAGHAVLDLRLECAVHRRPPDRRMRGADALVELLGGKRPLRGGQRLGDDEPLFGAPAPTSRQARLHRHGAHQPRVRGSDAI